MSEVKTTDISLMTDEEIENFTEEQIVIAPEDEAAADTTAAADASEGGSSEESTDDGSPDPENPDDETGGADDNEGSAEEDTESDDPSAEEESSSDEPGSDDEEDDESPEADQAEDKDESEDPEDDPDEEEATFEAKYKELMAPFKAAKRMVTVGSIDDARILMQKGVDYSRKMETLKPHLRILRTLEDANLLDPSRINFLIDLEKNDPAAIKKLLKDNDIDPMTLNLEGSEDYKPNDHAPSDQVLAVRDVFESIQHDEKFDETVDIITNKLDTASRTDLQDKPEVIAEIHAHVEAGIYPKVMDRVANERLYGRLNGLSDLQAYYTIGQQMFEAGEFNDSSQPQDPSSNDSKPNGTAQGSGSDTAKAEKAKADLRNRKSAAKPPRGKSAKAGKKRPDFSKMSDKEIEELDISSFD